MAGFLEGKNVAITGAGRGIGRAMALACAADGANVVVADIGASLSGAVEDQSVADEVVGEITAAGGTAVACTQSVTDMDGGAAIVQAAIDTWGSIDGVICVAGILRERTLPKMSEEEWDGVVATHLKGHFTVYRAAAAAMKEQGSGSIIGITSGAFAASVAQANYSAAKGGIVSLTRSAALGLYKYGVRANCIAPVARTRMSMNVPGGVDMGEPEDVAPMAVYLLSDAAAHVTGQIYTVNGGKIAVWNQPMEVRAMFAEGRWTPEQIAARLDGAVGQEVMPFLVDLQRREAAAKAAAAGSAGS